MPSIFKQNVKGKMQKELQLSTTPQRAGMLLIAYYLLLRTEFARG